jgi:hypothetical protein
MGLSGSDERENKQGETKMYEIKVTGKDFSYATKFLKKNGYTFSGTTKTWSGSKDVSFLIEEGYVVLVREASPLTVDCMSQNVEA